MVYCNCIELLTSQTNNQTGRDNLIEINKQTQERERRAEHTLEVAWSRSSTVTRESESRKSPVGNRASGFLPKSKTTSISW